MKWMPGCWLCIQNYFSIVFALVLIPSGLEEAEVSIVGKESLAAGATMSTLAESIGAGAVVSMLGSSVFVESPLHPAIRTTENRIAIIQTSG